MNQLAKILLIITLATICGLSLKHYLWFQTTVLPLSSTIGQLFLNALTMVVLPLVISSIILGVSQLGKDSQMKRLAIHLGLAFTLNSFSAVLIGWLVFNVFSHWVPANQSLIHSALPLSLHLENAHSLQTFILKLVPSNIFNALVKGEMLGIIPFSFMFGLFLNQLDNETSLPLHKMIKGVFETVLKMTHWLMQALPVAVFFLMIDASSKFEFGDLKSLAVFILMLITGYFIHMIIFWGLTFKFLGNISIISHLKAVTSALFTAFSTSSSAATFPVTLETLEKKIGVSNKNCSFILPLGTSVNMSGTALYLSVAPLFLAKVYGIPLTPTIQSTVIALSFLTSFGIAGIPSASLVAMMVIFEAINLPPEALGMIVGLERILDMMRTTANVYGNTACVSLIAAWQKEPLSTQNQSN